MGVVSHAGGYRLLSPVDGVEMRFGLLSVLETGGHRLGVLLHQTLLVAGQHLGHHLLQVGVGVGEEVVEHVVL